MEATHVRYQFSGKLWMGEQRFDLESLHGGATAEMMSN